MSYWVYILRSKNDGGYYIGHTQNLTERLERHNQGRVRYTKSKRPWNLVYSEKYPDRSSAMTREEEIKKRKSRQFIDSLVRTSRRSRREGREFESRRPRQLSKGISRTG
ncbi:MAG: GIY-YIG nuclease family protein [Desulfobacterales bacterium]|nr:GIY-YIG nuclease family protein [Deltaproteobacteria bacterium]NIR16671.1 GIY-YIG nuclease family protein [Desulfobacterales bacterium]